MRGRPALPLGKHGTIWTKKDGKVYTAYCYYRDADGVTRRVKASANKAEAARLKLQDRLTTRTAGSLGELGPDSTVQQLADAWLKQIPIKTTPDGEGMAQVTVDLHQRYLRNHVLPAFGALRLREVTTGRAEAFINTKRDKPAVARACRSVLKLMFAMAVRLDAVEQNPIEATKTVKLSGVVRAMAWDDVERFRAHIAAWADGRADREYVVDVTDLFIGTGLRPGELLGLLWSDIDFKARTLTVTGTVKKDSVNGLHRQAYPKSVAGERVLVLPEFVWPMLARRKLAAVNEKVFPGRFGGWRSHQNFHRTWAAARGTGEWAHVLQKDFRTAVATVIARESGSQAAAGQLGHSSDAVTARFYIERDKKAQDNSAVLGRRSGS